LALGIFEQVIKILTIFHQSKIANRQKWPKVAKFRLISRRSALHRVVQGYAEPTPACRQAGGSLRRYRGPVFERIAKTALKDSHGSMSRIVFNESTPRFCASVISVRNSGIRINLLPI
jgi:hypothetical protein